MRRRDSEGSRSVQECYVVSRRAGVPKSAAVSAQMSRMPSRDTTIELAVRRLLHAAGLRFRVHRRDLPGTPDVVLPRARLAIFIDGCFWHDCELHRSLPKNNREWWGAKFAATRERDQRKDAELAEIGWLPVHYWEHEGPAEIASDVVALWRHRTGRG